MHLVKLTIGRIANFSSCLLIGPFYANLHHQIGFIMILEIVYSIF